MATRLGLYNDALAHLGERKLVTVTDDDESRHTLDLHYDRALRYCLEQGLWNFALRTVELDASASLVPAFGYAFAFDKPADWIRSAQIASEARFAAPLARYEEEGALWYADVDPLYVQYVSDDASYGLDLAGWPETFADYVGCHLARRVCLRLTASDTRLERLERLEKRLRVDARAKDAMNQAVGRFPAGSWAIARGIARGARSLRLDS